MNPLPALLAVIAILLTASPAAAFLEVESGEAGFDLRGNIQLTSSLARNPKQPTLIFADNFSESTFATGRLLAEAWYGDSVELKLNVLQGFAATDLGVLSSFGLSAFGTVGRSDALRLRWIKDDKVEALLEADQLYLRFSLGAVADVRVGRQPIGLSSTFLFTPNDLFEPFTAEAFFREFKPGVDAIRADFALGDISQISVFGVMGYDPANQLNDDKLSAPSLDESALAMRAATVVWDYEWSLLAGQFADRLVFGAGLQGGLFEWLEVRGEGHAAILDKDRGTQLEGTIELSHRFDNTLNLQLAQFYHGAGLADADNYIKALSPDVDTGLYLGRHYTALGAGYELTPLLNLQAVGIVNWTDLSTLASFFLLYSLADEADMALTATLPFGEASKDTFAEIGGVRIPNGVDFNSEFGLSPRSFSLDFRMYF